MGLIVLGEREAGSEVRGDLDGGGSLSGGLLEVGNNGGVNGLLEGNSLGGDLVGDLGGTKPGCVSEALVTVSSSEGGVGDLGGVNTGEIDLGGGGHGVNLVDTLDGDTVNLVRSSDEEESGVKSLEHDNSLSSESTGEEDEDTSSFESSSELGGVVSLGSTGAGDVIGGVPGELFDHCFRV